VRKARHEPKARHKLQTRGEDAGLVHLEGMDQHDHFTFCGLSWSGENEPDRFEDTDADVDCPGCLRAIKQAIAILAADGRI
jgi:hypothetical protein